MIMKFFCKILFLIAILFFACSKKQDLNEFTSSGKINLKGDTVYIQLFPAWEGFNHPKDILVGNEPLIYVADTDNDRVVMMNLNGQILGTKTIKKPIALAQDYQLNLIVCGQDIINNVTVSAVYKIDLVSANHNIQNANVKRLLPQTDFLNSLDLRVEYTGACCFYDNSFYIARKGPSNTSFVDPDNSIIIFQKKILQDGSKIDTLIGRLPQIEPLGTGLLTANNISSITSFKRKNNDFITTFTGNTSFKVQWLYYNLNTEIPGYFNKLSPTSASIMKVNRFVKPEGCTIDYNGNIFIVDSEKDSVYKFNSYGDELQSFGGKEIFNNPFGASFFDKTLYITDTGNNRILRFILSTDIK